MMALWPLEIWTRFETGCWPRPMAIESRSR